MARRGRSKKKKQAKHEHSPQAGKTPVSSAATKKHGSIVWSFSKFDDHAFCTPEQHKGDAFFEIAKRLKSCELRPWEDIVASPRDHLIPVNKICKEAQGRLKKRKQDDIDALWCFRVNAKKRLWGTDEGNILRIMWWDPEHRICPSLKSNT